MIHQSVQKYSVEFETIYKRKNYSTPKNYLDFLDNYIQFLRGKRKEMDAAVRRLEGGLATLAKAAEDTQVLEEKLRIDNAEIADKKAIVEELISDINEKTETANKSAEAAAKTKAELEISGKQIAIEEEEAAAAVAAAVPALDAAKKAL